MSTGVEITDRVDQPPVESISGRAQNDHTSRGQYLVRMVRGSHTAALVGYLLGSLWLTQHLWPDLNGVRIAGNPGDIDQYQWWLGWWTHALAEGTNPFTTDLMNMPVGVNLMVNNSMAFVSLVTSGLFATIGPLATYNILSILGPALSGFAFHLCARRVGIAGWPAFAGGLVFGFSPAITHSLIGHINMVMAALLPVLVLLNVRAWTTPRPRWTGIALGLVAFVQTMTAEEVLFQAGVATLVAIIVAAVSRPALVRSALATAGRTYTWAFLVYLPLAAYPLYCQFLGPRRQHGSPFWIDYFSADLSSFTNPSPLLLNGPGANAEKLAVGPEEQLSYLGWPLIIFCFLVAVRYWGDIRVRVATVGLALSMTLSLGGTLWVHGQQTRQKLPYAWLEKLPVVENALPSRFGLLSALFAATLFAIGIHAVSNVDLLRVRVGTAVLGTLVLLALVPRPVPVEPVADVPRYFTSAARDLPAGTAALVVPFPRHSQTEPLRWQTAAGYSYAAPGGYFIGPGSDGHAYIGAPAGTLQKALVAVETKGGPVVITDESRRIMAAEVTGWGIDVAILGPARHHRELRALLTQLFGPATSEGDGVVLWDRPVVR